ncbi:ribosomal protein S18 acetylase RimI-like enzyme [Pseudomonas rhodesiae]|nr:ribosomal protein S18 acetylase RimI-like enzyme [Pseudomonas rhodesiae]MDF9769664.1 ribosomal protein S18 acetylase RimI-like enzyme [Pseudomonas rhodesiae]
MTLCFRIATLDDIPALTALEQQCFTGDRLSPRSFRWMVRRANGQLWLAERDAQLQGYALVLLRRSSAVARLYSIAIAEPARGLGLGAQLLARIEACGVQHRCTRLRLEVRTDNLGALALYERRGYRRLACTPDYYEDNCAALRLEKVLAAQ